MTKSTYCAIIGDITRSRDLPNRATIQRRFLRSLEQVNAEFADAIVSDFRFRVTEGDSFEGLLNHPALSYRFTRRIREHMEPVPFTIGIGAGTLSTAPGRNVDAVDGEAFHRARAALDLARKRKQEVLFDLESPSLALLNALVGLMEKERGRLTPRQREVVRWMDVLDNQAAVARKLKISQPAVSKVLNVPTIRKLSEAEQVLGDFLRGWPHGVL
jgi:hypothetical protein